MRKTNDMTTPTISRTTERGNPIATVALQATGAANEFTPLSIEDKASVYAETAIWTRIDDAPLSLLCLSPVSRNVYRLDYDEFTDKVRCNCQRGFCRKSCWHATAFRNTMLAPLYAMHKAAKGRPVASTNHAPTDARSRGDFDVDCEMAAKTAPRLSHPNPVGLGAYHQHGGKL